MNNKIQLLKKISPKFREIAQKWEERQKIEEALGIPTSEELTIQFIFEDLPEDTVKDILIQYKNIIGGMNG